MNNNKLVFWVWSSMQQLPPHQLRIYPLNFFAAFITIFLLTYILSFSILLVFIPSGLSIGLPDSVGAALKIPLWYFSHGFLWSAQAPKLLTLITSKGQLLPACYASIAVTLSLFNAWKLSNGQLTPRTAYIHIRGPRRYEGEEAIRVLKKKLSNKGD